MDWITVALVIVLPMVVSTAINIFFRVDGLARRIKALEDKAEKKA